MPTRKKIEKKIKNEEVKKVKVFGETNPYYPVVQIIWADIVSSAGWLCKEDSLGISICRTLGFLVRNTETTYIVSSTTSESDFCGAMTIPKAVVSEITYLDLVPERIEVGKFKPEG